MPRKMAGSAMMTIEALTVAASMPRVVLERATHLYRPSAQTAPAGVLNADRLTHPIAPGGWNDPVVGMAPSGLLAHTKILGSSGGRGARADPRGLAARLRATGRPLGPLPDPVMTCGCSIFGE